MTMRIANLGSARVIVIRSTGGVVPLLGLVGREMSNKKKGGKR